VSSPSTILVLSGNIDTEPALVPFLLTPSTVKVDPSCSLCNLACSSAAGCTTSVTVTRLTPCSACLIASAVKASFIPLSYADCNSSIVSKERPRDLPVTLPSTSWKMPNLPSGISTALNPMPLLDKSLLTSNLTVLTPCCGASGILPITSSTALIKFGLLPSSFAL